MAAATTTFTIDHLAIPDTLDGADGADFVEVVEVRNQIEAEIMGNRDLAYDPAELLPRWQNPYEPKSLYVARVDGRIVGRAVYETEIAEGAKAAWVTVEVLTEFRGRGIGAAFYERLSDLAVAEGRSVLQSFAVHALSETVDTIDSPTGFGSVPRDDDGVRFLLAHGFSLEQVARCSRLDLPVDEAVLAGFSETSATAAGADYRVVTWEGRTPPEWRTDLALLHQRMSTDAPFAGLEQQEDPWDADRIAELDERNERSPRRILLAAAVHVPTNTLVAFNELGVSSTDVTRPVAQQDTLVLSEHRGHRLGMLVKTANLVALRDSHPGHPSVITYNAEENRHMLRVNEALGFVAVGYEGAWKKVL